MRGTVELDQYVGIDSSVAYFQALDSSVCYKQRRKDIAFLLFYTSYALPHCNVVELLVFVFFLDPCKPFPVDRKAE